MRIIETLIGCFTLIPSCLYAQEWVDMGIRTEDGDIIYWSNSDLGLRKDGRLAFVGYGEIGSVFGWGDITGQANGKDLSKFGGANPPNSIEGNPQYDIITAKLGKEYRLPTWNEYQQLIDNCGVKTITIERKNNVGKNGLPSWVQGQWMWHSAALANGRVMNASITLKIDGYLASVYTSDNDYWEGSYTYSNGNLKVWKLDLIVDESNRTIKDDRGYQYQKISNKAESKKIKGFLYTSKINGNTLLFPLPPTVSTATTQNGQYTIAWENEQEVIYWTGTLFLQEKSKEYATTFMSNDNGRGIVAFPRSEQHRMRAVKVDFGSGARLAEEKRIAEQKAAVEKAMREELERLKAEKERLRFEQLRAEAYANDPIIKGLSLFDTEDKTVGIFDYKMYIDVPNTYDRPQKVGVLLLFYSNRNTKELYKEFWERVNSGESNNEHRRFIEEKLGKTLPNIVKCLNDFSIVDADGHTYSLKLDEALPKAFEQKEWLRYQVEGSYRNATCILRPVLDGENVGLTIGTVNLSVFPFLQKEHSKGEKLYYCDFELPFSSSYSIISNGKKIKGDIVDHSVFWQLKSGKK